MSELPTIRNEEKLLSTLEQWRQKLQAVLPNDREIVRPPGNSWFVVVDARTIKFRFDPGPNAEAHDVEWSQDPEFRTKKGTRVHSDALEWEANLHDTFSCDGKYYFRVRGVKGRVVSRWSPTAVFGPPTPAALRDLVAFHTVDNVEEENPIINVNVTLPRTAVLGGRTIEDFEAVWTDHVDLEGANWSELEGAIDDSQTTMTVPMGQGAYFKPSGFYKIEDEIIGVASVLGDVVTIERGHFGTTPAAHADMTEIRLFVRLLREMFSGSDQGSYGVTVTLNNDEKVRDRAFEAWPVNRCGDRGPMSSYALTLPLPGTIDDLVADPRFRYIILRWSELPWTAYRYEVYHSTSGAVPIGDVDPTLTPGVEKLARPLADHEGEFEYQHNVDFAAGTVHFYGVRAIDILGGFGTGDTVGPVQPDQFASNPAPDVTDISATEGPAMVGGGRSPRSRHAVVSSVTCGFEPPDLVADPNSVWQKCNIYLQATEAQTQLAAGIDDVATVMQVLAGDIPLLQFHEYYRIDSEVVRVTNPVDYVANTVTIVRGQFGTTPASHSINSFITPFEQPKLAVGGEEAPLQFLHAPIGIVTLYFVSVSKDGTENQILSSPNLTVDLDAQTSVPLEVQNLFGLKTIHGGRIFWSEGLEPDLTHYEIADLGSRTLQAQADILPEHIVARMEAKPGSENKVSYEWVETHYEGDISASAKTIVLVGDDKIVEDRFEPLGTPPVKETLRFTRLDADPDNLTETDYPIDANTENTIVLQDVPTEATNGGRVFFYIGGRAHKFYVRAVNSANLASEWRPVEGTFLELSSTAPDGSHDVGVPKIENILGSNWQLGTTLSPAQPGHMRIRLAAVSEFETESDFDLALKRSIGGVDKFEVEIKHSPDGVTNLQTLEISHTASNERSRYSWAGNFWSFAEVLPLISLPGRGIASVRARVHNYFGWSQWYNINIIVPLNPAPGAGPFFTGQSVLEIEETVTPTAGIIRPNLAKSTTFKAELAQNVTFNSPEYRHNAATSEGSGEAPKTGEIFTVTVEQDGAGGREAFFSSEYRGLDGKEVDLRPNRYTSWTFIAVSANYFRCISYLSGDR